MRKSKHIKKNKKGIAQSVSKNRVVNCSTKADAQQVQVDFLKNENYELYFEILGFEQNSAIQIVKNYADECNIELRIPDSLIKKQELQEYGILARGTKESLMSFFNILRSLFQDKLLQGNLAEFAIEKLKQKSLSICVAESCTGGVLSSMLTSVNGASNVYKGGIVAYNKEIKLHVLGIKESILKEHGVYSEECVKAMARCALDLFHADIAIATSGLTTHDASKDNFLNLPSGLVFTCVLMRDKLPLVIAHNYLQHAETFSHALNNKIISPQNESSRIFVQHNASLQALRLLFEIL